MFGIDMITSYLLVVALATLLVAVLVWQTHRTGRTVIVWLAAGALGLILGSIGSYAVLCTLGYQVAKAPPKDIGTATAGAPSGMPGMGGMGGGMGMGGAAAGMAAAMGAPQPKRDLTTLVRKLDLLTGDIAVTLTSEQAVAVSECLKDVEKPDKMSDDDAKAKHDKLLAVFNDAQKARFEQIGLPGAGRGAGGSGGMMGKGGGMMGKGGPGGPKQDQDQNPFQQESTGKALKSLRDRLAAKGGAEKPKPSAEAPKPSTEAPKATAEKPKPSEAPKPSSEPPKAAADKAPAKKS